MRKKISLLKNSSNSSPTAKFWLNLQKKIVRHMLLLGNYELKYCNSNQGETFYLPPRVQSRSFKKQFLRFAQT